VFGATEKSLDDLMRTVIVRLMADGSVIHPTKGAAREIVGATLELTDPRARLSRSEARSTAFSALGELLWYLSGSASLDDISYYIPKYKEFAVDGRIEGAYGPRLMGDERRLHEVIEVLRTKKDSRQAVIQVFEHADLSNKFDVPCTCTIQFFLRHAVLDVVVYMRSNDAFRGLPHDIFCFTMIQELVARSVGAEVGRYIHMVGSLHLYEENIDHAERFLGEGWQATSPMPPMPPGDQADAVTMLLRTERELRLGELAAPAADIMSEPYWRDLASMLWAFASSRRDGGLLDPIVAGLQNDYFKVYLTDRQLKVEGR
jgi:thymidylate synthase